MHVDNITQIKFMLHKIKANFPKVRFTYIKLRRHFRKQLLKTCAPNITLFDVNLLQYKLHTIKVTVQWGMNGPWKF